MRILVVGAGAIGCLVGGRLAAAGYDVTLVVRPWLANTIGDSGLRLNISGETLYVPDVVALTTAKEAVFEFGPFDLVLFTMKSYDTAAGIRELTSAARRPPTVLSLQNGVGNEQRLSDAFGPEHVIAGVITAPAEMPVPGVVRASSGAVGLAPLEPATPVGPIAEAFQAAGFKTRIYADWRSLTWSKLLLNMLGNATSAILDWPPERVFAHSELFDLEWKAWREALAVMKAQDIQAVSLPGYPVPWAIRVLRWLPRPLRQPVMKRIVAGGRGGKMPSLHIDLQKGKTKSEVAVLNGAVVEAGWKTGVPTPVNAALAETLMAIAQGKLDWDEFRDRPDRLIDVAGSKQGHQEQVRG